MKKAALYCRVSSTTQAQEGDSIPAQLDALRNYANAHKYHIVGEFVDDGISGTKYNRDELQSLLRLVEQDQVDIILMTKMDRLHRSLRNFLNMQDILDAHHCDWIAIWEPNYDTTTPQGRMIINMMMNLAEFEANQTGQRIRQVQEYKVRQREVISGNTSPGYSIIDKHLVVNGDAPVVRLAFETFNSTGSLAKTLRATTGTSLPTTANGMKRMLSRKWYIGEAYGIRDFCEPIIDRQLFDSVQNQLNKVVKSNQKRVYLFSGLLRCADCGASMAGNARVKRGKEALIYRCPKHYQRVHKTCDNPKTIYETVVERHLLSELPHMIASEVEIRQKKRASSVDTKRQVDALRKRVERLKELYVLGEIDIDEYRADKEQLLIQIDELSSQDAPTAHEDALISLSGMNLEEIYADLSRAEKRQFWRGIVKDIRFGKDRQIFATWVWC